jgi:alkylhydroperoxidase family enzyme
MTLRIELSEYGGSPFQRIIGHNRVILDRWNDLEDSFYAESSLDSHLLEQVRRGMAFQNHCEYCMVKGGRPDVGNSDPRTERAVAFAELFALDHLSVTEDHFSELKEFFSEKEISELCTFISFLSASQRLGRVMNLTEEYQSQGVATLKELDYRPPGHSTTQE